MFVLAEFESLFVQRIFKFYADTVVHFEDRYFQMWMLDIANDAHVCRSWAEKSGKNAKNPEAAKPVVFKTYEKIL